MPRICGACGDAGRDVEPYLELMRLNEAAFQINIDIIWRQGLKDLTRDIEFFRSSLSPP